MRLLVGVIFDEYGVFSYKSLAEYESLLVQNLSDLEDISRQLDRYSLQSSSDIFVLSSLHAKDSVIRLRNIENAHPALILGKLYINRPSPLLIKKVLRSISAITILLVFLYILFIRFKKASLESTYSYSKLTSR